MCVSVISSYHIIISYHIVDLKWQNHLRVVTDKPMLKVKMQSEYIHIDIENCWLSFSFYQCLHCLANYIYIVRNTSAFNLPNVVHCADSFHDIPCLQGEAACHVHILQRQAGSGQNTNKHVKWWCYSQRHVNASIVWVPWLMPFLSLPV